MFCLDWVQLNFQLFLYRMMFFKLKCVSFQTVFRDIVKLFSHHQTTSWIFGFRRYYHVLLGLGSAQFSTFSIPNHVRQIEMSCLLDGVQRHSEAIWAPSDHFLSFQFSTVLLYIIMFCLDWVQLNFQLFLYRILFVKLICFSFKTVFKDIRKRLEHHQTIS